MTSNNQTIFEWLDKKYIERILNKNKEKDSIKVKNIKLESACGKNQNYCGILSRIHIEYDACNQNKLNQLIIKSSMKDTYVQEAYREYDIVLKEMQIYNDFIPKINDLLNSIHYENALFPEVIHVDYEKQLIIMEDLAAKSFVMTDRRKGLDLSHIKLTLQKLAKMHAASAVLNKTTNGSLEIFDRGIFNRYTNRFAPCFQVMLNYCADMIKEFGGPFVQYSEKLRKLAPHAQEYGLDAFTCNPNNFNVLVHGDVWVNNIMFKYNANNEPIDAVLLDFQYSSWGSPALDLHYFLNNSVNEQFTNDNKKECVQFYYDELASTLRGLNFVGNIPSFKEFHAQYLSNSFYELVSACIFQPFMINENTEVFDLRLLSELDERGLNYKRKLYENPRVKYFIKKSFPFFSSTGLLDLH